MIYGVIPVGGKGTRLSLPFSKEMLPQKHYDYYNPVINHTVEKMFLAGANKICLVHGAELKQDIVKYFTNDPRIYNISQFNPSFAGVLSSFLADINCEDNVLNVNDKILFGLPDSVYDKNPFVDMLLYSGVVCGLFKGDTNLKVDRLSATNDQHFYIKTKKDAYNRDFFWGVLKFDGIDLADIVTYQQNTNENEIGTLLNRVTNKFYIYGNDYVDLGTWAGYNKYICGTKSFSNTEVERKYNAEDIALQDFKDFCEHFYETKYLNIPDTKDYYFTNDNPNIEFIRYRDGGSNIEDKTPNITVKNFVNSPANRFELTIPLSPDKTNTEDIIHYMSLTGLKYRFFVEVDSHIFYNDKFILVMYSFNIGDKLIKLIEIELKTIDFNIIEEFEHLATQNLKGFSSDLVLYSSKFQIIKEELNDKN